MVDEGGSGPRWISPPAALGVRPEEEEEEEEKRGSQSTVRNSLRTLCRDLHPKFQGSQLFNCPAAIHRCGTGYSVQQLAGQCQPKP